MSESRYLRLHSSVSRTWGRLSAFCLAAVAGLAIAGRLLSWTWSTSDAPHGRSPTVVVCEDSDMTVFVWPCRSSGAAVALDPNSVTQIASQDSEICFRVSFHGGQQSRIVAYHVQTSPPEGSRPLCTHKYPDHDLRLKLPRTSKGNMHVTFCVFNAPQPHAAVQQLCTTVSSYSVHVWRPDSECKWILLAGDSNMRHIFLKLQALVGGKSAVIAEPETSSCEASDKWRDREVLLDSDAIGGCAFVSFRFMQQQDSVRRLQVGCEGTMRCHPS